MCRTQWLLALVAVYVGLASSWDIAVGVRNQLIFYTNGTETNTVDFISQKITALAYDEVHNRMLYVDKQSNNDAICGYGISSRKNKCFIKRTGGSIHSIAFDPATQTLFFTDTNYKSISCISLKSGSANNVKANLIKMDDGTPKDIAVDSCRGYIYWINTNMTDKYYKTSIERAQFNGSGREIILKRIGEEFEVLSLAIDPPTQKIYYLYSDGNVLKYLNYVDLNGQHDRFMYGYFGPYNSLRELTVSENYLYWVDTTKSYNTVWQLSKSANLDSRPKKISYKFSTKEPLAIATNYKIEDQIQGLEDCDALSGLIPMITVTDKPLNIEQTTEYTTDVCDWTPDYILQITCSNCNSGYTGERCEVSVCCGYCSNNGTCSLNENSEPVCECKQDFVGDRCEVYNNNNKVPTTSSSTSSTSTTTSTTSSTTTTSSTSSSTSTSTTTTTTTTTNDHNNCDNNNNNNNHIVDNNNNSNNDNNNNNNNIIHEYNIEHDVILKYNKFRFKSNPIVNTYFMMAQSAVV